MRKGRGGSLPKVIREATLFLLAWVAYNRLSKGKNVFEKLNQWMRR